MKFKILNKNKNYNLWTLVWCCLLLPQIIFGQEENNQNVVEEIITSSLHLTCFASGDSIVLKWAPTSVENWLNTFEHGFQISRKTLGSNGEIQSGNEVIIAGKTYAEQVRIKSQPWFQQNGARLDGTINHVGAILYDADYNVGKNGENNDEARFDALVKLADFSNFISELVGWSFVDKKVENGKQYEYIIKSLNSTGQILIAEKLAINNVPGQINQFPIGYTHRSKSKEGENTPAVMSGVKINQVLMTALPMGDSIVLRWGPNNAKFWSESNKSGYILTRSVLNDSEENNSFRKLILPYDSTQFVQLVNPDSMVMVAAQVLYGKTIGVRKGNFIDQNSDLENRFAFSMLASERSAKAADVLGLRYVDRDVEAGKTYQYNLMSRADSFILSTYMLTVENLNEAGESPALFKATPLDEAIELTWSKDYNQGKFSTYRIERSDDDGKTFQKLNDAPLLFLNNDEAETADFVYLDSVEHNYKTYQYRLYGLNTFAQWSTPAELSIQAIDLTPPRNPFIVTVEEEGNGVVKINWDIEKEPTDLKGYSVLLGQTDDGDFEKISDNILLPGTKVYTYRTDTLRTDISYYFKVSAVDTAGNASESFAHFLNVVDSIPPAPPTGLIGTIDTLGVVTIGWEVGTEEDLNGYRVFYANSADYEFTQKTVSVSEYNFFIDSIEIKTLTEEIYYKVQAVDMRHNRGEFSEVLKLQKPDILPPTTPVFRQPQVSADSIILTWIPSVSDDVVSHFLYRKKHKSEDEWEILATLGAEDTLFVDLTADTEQLYEYTLRAQDDADLFSDYAFVHKARKWFDGKIVAIQNLEITYDTTESKRILLAWEFEKPTDELLKNEEYRFYLYRSWGYAPLERYKQLDNTKRDYIDTKIRKPGKYNYAVKVVFKNGKTSPLSEMVFVEK
jgi:fibronectin type 3 domain-containing protein